MPRAGRKWWLQAAIGGAALLAPAALAGAASAAAIAPTAACFVNVGGREAAVGILGSGFIAGDDIAVSGNGFFASGTALGNGAVVLTGGAPILPTLGPVVRTFTLEAEDEDQGPTVLATTAIKVTNLAASVTPDSVHNVHRDRVTYRFSGFRPGRHIYEYFRRKQTLARFTFGKASAPCGTAKGKDLLFPGGHPGHDKYTVTFEQTKRFSKKAVPRIISTLNLFTF